MDEFIIALQAKLDEVKSQGNINADIGKLQSQLDKLKIQAEIDQNSISNIINQMSKLGIQLGQDFGKTFNNGLQSKINANLLNQFKKISDSSTSATIQNEKKIQQTIKQTTDVYKTLSKEQSVVKSGASVITFDVTNDAAKKAQEHFSKLLKDEQAIIATTENFDQNNSLTSFTVNIKRASGEVESLRYAIATLKDDERNIEKKIYGLSGSSIGDAGALKQIKQIESAFTDYTQKIAQFKSGNSEILSGLTKPLADFENKLYGLKPGTSTIEELTNSFRVLNTEASNITANFRRQLNPIDAAIRNLAKGEETISGLKAEFKGLNNTPKEINSELEKCAKLLKIVTQIEFEQGRTVNWSQAYKDWEISIDSLKAKLNTLKKEQSNTASSQVFNVKDLDAQGKIYIQKINNTIAKTKSILESKLRKLGYVDIEIKGIESATGKVKALTATVTDATGAFKQLNFERAKIQNKGKAQSGFIQTDDVKVIGDLSSAVGKVQNNLQELKTKWEEQGLLVDNFKSKIKQLETSLSTVGSKNELNTLSAQIKELMREATIIAKTNKIQFSIDNDGYESQVKSLIAKTRQWTDENGNARISTNELSKAFDQLTIVSNNYTNTPIEAHQKELISAEKELDKQIQIITNSVRSMNAELAKDSAVSLLHNNLVDFMGKNGKTVKYYGTALKDILNQTEQGAKLTNKELATLKQRFLDIQGVARQTGKLGKTFFQTIKEGMSSFSYWTSSTFLVMKTIQSIKSAIHTVTELDTALVDLKKTAKMTVGELNDFYNSANDTAKQMGVTTEEIIKQAAAWSRLGFSTSEAATKMAKYSSMFATISPGMDLNSATDGLISVMKAFKIGLKDTDDVVDGIMSKINIIGNTQAVNNSDIVEFLTRSSSAMAEANNTLEDTIALGTAMVEITRDASGAGQVLKTVSMRIRGYDEETEEYIGNVEELSGKIANLTKTASTPGGISLFSDKAKTEYKSTRQILQDISEIYDQLTDKDQADLLEALAGKRNGQAVASVLNNFDTVTASLESMANSAGNAESEMSVAMDSIDYKLNTLKETGTGISQNLFGREDIKTILDLITSFGNGLDWLTDKLGLLGTIGLGAGIFAGFKNVGRDKMYSLIFVLKLPTIIYVLWDTKVFILSNVKYTRKINNWSNMRELRTTIA